MKKWYLIDDCLHGARQVFETALDCDSQEEAFDLATREWEALSAHDQRARDDFYIGFADVDEDGCVDYNTMTDIISIKKGERPMKKLWYAVQQDPSDDWSTGSYDRDEAVQMARAQFADYPDTLIAVIDKSTSNPVCVDEIRDF